MQTSNHLDYSRYPVCKDQPWPEYIGRVAIDGKMDQMLVDGLPEIAIFSVPTRNDY